MGLLVVIATKELPSYANECIEVAFVRRDVGELSIALN